MSKVQGGSVRYKEGIEEVSDGIDEGSRKEKKKTNMVPASLFLAKGEDEKSGKCAVGVCCLSPSLTSSVQFTRGKNGTALLHETAWLSNSYPHFLAFLDRYPRKRSKKNQEETKRTSLLSSFFFFTPQPILSTKGEKDTSTHWNLTGRQSSNGYKDNLPRKTRTSSRTCPDNLLFRRQYHCGGPMPKNSDHKDPSGYLKIHTVLMVFQFQSPQIRIPWTDTISIIDTGKPGTLRTSHFPALPRHPPNPRPPKPSIQQQHRRPHLHPCRSQSNR